MHPHHDLVLRYATELSWRIRPCHRGEKRPLSAKDAAGEWRALEPSNDEAQICAWLRQYPYANWQVLCGDDLVVIDAESMSAARQLPGIFASAGSEFPRVPTVETGGWGCGCHVYFRRPADVQLVSQFWLRYDIEVRATKSFCLLPPSTHPDTGVCYQWLTGHSPFDPDVPLSQLPMWLCDLMKPLPPTERKPFSPTKIGDRYIAAAINGEAQAMADELPGGRNHALFRRTAQLCRRFVDNGLADEQQIRDAMTSAGIASGLGEVEVRSTIRSASRRPVR
jgi:hypothetical protein